jgi:hypothetical protein
MKSKYHIEITRKALSFYFTLDALHTILMANILQDRIINQIGRDYLHFDSNTFDSGMHYIHMQEEMIFTAIASSDFTSARKALGHICHSWQDFYSHSNYVRLWVDREGLVPPSEIDHDDPNIMNSLHLRSGINYGLFDALALIPGLGKIITPLMPEDSHAKMNLDSPKSGELFEYAYQAALKRTRVYFSDLIQALEHKYFNKEKIAGFKGQGHVK